MNECKVHQGHAHQHGPDCGHKAVIHEGHTDYLHEGHLHHVHDNHVDCHSFAETGANASACTPAHDCGEHGHGKHVHGPDCGHDAVPHGNHIDYLVKGHLHHPHGTRCDDHGQIQMA